MASGVTTRSDPFAFRELARRARLPFVLLAPVEEFPDVPPVQVNAVAAGALSRDVCLQFGIVAIGLSEGRLTVATSDPGDNLVRDLVRALSGRETDWVVAMPEQIEWAIDAAFGQGEAVAAADSETEAVERAHEETDIAALEELRPRMIGSILLDHGVLEEDQLEGALHEQRRTGDRLGEILVHSGVVDEATLVEVLARQFELPLVDLADIDAASVPMDLIPEPMARRLRCVAIGVDERHVYVAVADVLDDETVALLREHTGLEPRSFLASKNAIDELLQRIHSGTYSATATSELLARFPEDCANRVVSPAQRNTLLVIVAVVLGLLVLFPVPTLVGLISVASLFYTSVSLYKLVLMGAALGHAYEIEISTDEVDALDERDLPVYTLLVPLYKEASVVPRLVAGIGGLNYPKTKLDVRLLCEEDDEETVAAIRDLRLPPHFKLVIVPDSQPKTKPKACNYGLLQAEGEIVVIYDAEDRPDPDQLKKVVLAFQKAGPRVTCVQAKLNYFNQDQNVLTRWFSAEYSMWFDLILPGLDHAKVPIPLGGTSNHFLTERLVRLAAWDPFNVTEDADLGIRLHKAGYETAIIDSTTLEEANSVVDNWVRQRSRWIKGYIQTWLVHMRHPVRLARQLGLKSFFSFQMVIGGTFIFLLNPIFWLLTTLFFFTEANLIEQLFPSFIFYVAAAQLFLGNFAFMYLNLAGALQRRYYRLVKFGLLTPIYWGLMSLAAWKGFIQLFTNPFYWEKTVHGLDTPDGG